MFARTKRLVLRPGWAEDAQALADAIGHEDVLRNLLRAPMPYETRDAEEFLNRGSDARLPDFLAFARTGAAPRLVGGCGIARRDDGDRRRPPRASPLASGFHGWGVLGTVKVLLAWENRAV